jgi:cytidylate kinase
MTIVTISRQLGCHGEEIAARVAETLGLRLVDAKTIDQAAQMAGVPQEALAEWQHEGEHSLATQVLKALRAMPNTVFPVSSPAELGSATAIDRSSAMLPFSGLFSPLTPPISASVESYVRMVSLVIRGLAHEGNVLIAGRGGQIILNHHPNTLHVQIVAPFAYRLAILQKRFDLDKRVAQQRLRASDRARCDYVRRYHGANWLDPTLYHLVINTGCLSVAAAVDLIVSAQRALACQSESKNQGATEA